MIYLKLFCEFFKIGLFTIGGGLATLPLLKDLSERTNWFSTSLITDMIAISESTPGPIGINMATYIGYTVGNIWGGIIATIGEIIPSIIIVSLVSKFLTSFQKNKKINNAFYGIRPTVTALITAAGLEVFNISVINMNLFFKGIFEIIDLIKILLFIGIFYFIKKYNKHPIIYIAISALVGIIFKLK